jgi:hypothetical protein
LGVIYRKLAANKSKQSASGNFMKQDEFLELIQKLPDIIRDTEEMVVLDKTVRAIYSNFSVDGKKVTKSRLNEPFHTIFKEKVPEGAR